MYFRDLHAQYCDLKKEIDASIMQVIDSGVFIGGEPVKELERELAEYVGVKHCITCGNGTDALQLALMAWGIGEGDAVFVPDFTFFSSGEVVSAVGATPVFVDVDARTFNIDPVKLEDAIRAVKKDSSLVPRVVVAVDLFGLPADYPAVRQICDHYDLLLLEDGAQGFGGSINEKMACSFGDISTTSFFPAKPLGCYGDGGAVFTDNDEWAALVRSYAVHGKGSMKYDNVRIGMNSRLDTLQAAILRVKLMAFIRDELVAVNEAAQHYVNCFARSSIKETGLLLPTVSEGYFSSWAQYTIQLPQRISRNVLQMFLKENGIPTAIYYPKPMHAQKAFLGKGMQGSSFERTESLCASVLSLPIGPYIAHEEVALVVDRLEHFLAQ